MDKLKDLHDITDIPVFAWEAGSAIWTGLALFMALGLLFTLLYRASQRRLARPEHLLRRAQTEISSLCAAGEIQGNAVAMALRRLLCLLEDPAIMAESAAQLRLRASTEARTCYAALLSLLASLDDLRFAGLKAEHDLKQVMLRIPQALSAYIKERGKNP